MIKAGTLVVVTSEVGDEYGIWAVCRVLEDLNVKELRAEYSAHHSIPEEAYTIRELFKNWLIDEKQILKELPFSELYLGAGRSLEMMSFKDSESKFWTPLGPIKD